MYITVLKRHASFISYHRNDIKADSKVLVIPVKVKGYTSSTGGVFWIPMPKRWNMDCEKLKRSGKSNGVLNDLNSAFVNVIIE